MFSFFRRNKKLPAFEKLESSPIQHMYFVRAASWLYYTTDHITIFDPNGPRIFTLDPWPEKIFVEANGEFTIAQYIHQLAGEYSGPVPLGLDETVLHEITTLLNHHFIELKEEKGRPESEFDHPIKSVNA